MLLNSQNSQFVFQFPQTFVPEKMNARYVQLLEKNWIPYENVVDYLNSTIKGIDFGGITITTSERVEFKSKKRNYRPSVNFYDVISTNDISIEIRRADADINYWMLHNIIKNYYANPMQQYAQPFYMSVLDVNRDEIYRIVFREILLTELSPISLNFSQQTVEQKTFTLTFSFNWYDVEFMLDPNNVLVTDENGEVLIKESYSPDF